MGYGCCTRRRGRSRFFHSKGLKILTVPLARRERTQEPGPNDPLHRYVPSIRSHTVLTPAPGEGSLQMSIQEVGTMIKKGVCPYLFVINNDGYVPIQIGARMVLTFAQVRD